MKKRNFFEIFALALLIAACSNPSGSDFSGNTDGVEFTETFNGNNGSTKYTLIVSHPVTRAAVGDVFSLKVARDKFEKTSSGKIVSVDGTNLVYQPMYKDAKSFSVGFNGTKLTHITGTITFDDGTSELGPGGFTNGSSVSGGGSRGGGSAATGISLTITQPAPITRGTKQLFTAIVNGTNIPDQKAVTWQIKGGVAKGTSISPDGLLTVDESEPATTLIVTAISAFDPKKSGSATVILSGLLNVVTPALELPMISEFSVIQNSDLTLAVNVANKDKIDDQHSIPGIGGNISYQWYSNTKDSKQGLTAINGATDLSYKVPTTTDGTLYYYVGVTNTIDIDDPDVVDTNVITALAGPVTVTVTKIPTEPNASILILQVGAATDGDISHSFVELYNPGGTDINLSGYTLQYAAGFSTNQSNGSGPGGNTTTDGPWKKIDLTGTIKARTSFLILGKKGTGTNPALSITDGYGDINNSNFELNNRALKVALMSNTIMLTVQNPFTSNSSGYVDMVGALNTENTDYIQGFEKNKITNLNKNTGQRRKSLTDTNDNAADFERAVYNGATADQKEVRRPKNQTYGAWNPIQTFIEPSDPPVISSVGRTPVSVTSKDTVTVSATVTTTGATISTVILQWTLGGVAKSNINMTATGNVYSATIPVQAVGSVVTYKVLATNNLGKSAITAEQNYTVVSVPVDYTKLKLNEVSGAGGDDDKFYELKNTGVNDIPLEGCKIYYNGNGSTGGMLPTGKGSLTWTGLSTQIAGAGQLFSLIGRYKPGSFSAGLTGARILIITLEDPAGNEIDRCVRAADTGEYEITDKSFSRIPDGTGDFYFTTPTPDATNGTSIAGLKKLPNGPPAISTFSRDPSSVTPTDTVTVSATVTAVQTILPISTVVLKWTINGTVQSDINMTAVGNVYSTKIPPQSVGSVVAYKVLATNNLGETNSTVEQNYTVASVSNGQLMILQANTYGNANQGFKYSLVELYNNTNTVINLNTDNYYLHIGTADTWTYQIKLTGTIPSNCSYLIVSSSDVNTSNPRATLPTADQTNDFVIINNNFKIALMKNKSSALSVANPFGDTSLSADYVDMLGCGTTNGYETTAASAPSRPQVRRRISLIDTDVNSADFVNVDYRAYSGNNGMPDSDLYKYWPRNVALGAWNPITGLPKVDPIVP